MRKRAQVVNEMMLAARPSEPDKYLLRLLKASLLQLELLLDVRDLLVDTYNRQEGVLPIDYEKKD